MSDPRFINCEACQTEGRILTNNGGPDDVDHGPCPDCNGARVVEVETFPITLDDITSDVGTPQDARPLMTDDNDHIGPYNGRTNRGPDIMANGCLWIVGILFAFIVIFGAYGFYADWTKHG